MNDKAVQAAVAKFLKRVTPTVQREIEKAIHHAIASGKLRGHESWTAAIAFSSEKVGLDVTIYGKIEL